jgi:hypothetical protein
MWKQLSSLVIFASLGSCKSLHNCSPWNTPPFRFAATSFSSWSRLSLMMLRGVMAAGWAVLPDSSIGRMVPWSCTVTNKRWAAKVVHVSWVHKGFVLGYVAVRVRTALASSSQLLKLFLNR